MKIKLSLMYALSLLQALQATTNELPLVISICAYNDAPYVEKNLDSIFMQDYSNFRVEYVDDASSDETVELVKKYIQKHELQDRISIHANKTRCRKLKNIYNLFHTCDDEEIIIQVDGDDWLAHDQVFSIINQTYQEKDVWLTYGQFIGHDQSTAQMCKPVPSDIIENRSFKSWDWVYSHVRTFKAWLFKSIPLKELINVTVPGFKGQFYPVANDMITVFSMLEMCGDKFAFIPDILYIYNRGNPFHTGKLEGKLYAPAKQELRSRPKLDKVNKPILNRIEHYKDSHADCIALIKDKNNVNNVLENVHTFVKNIANIILITDNPKDAHLLIKENILHNAEIKLIAPSELSIDDLCSADHILLTSDEQPFLHTIDCNAIIKELERTFAYGWYCNLTHQDFTEHNIASQHIKKHMYAWKFKRDKYKKFTVNTFNGAMFRKSTIANALKEPSNSIIDLQNAWASQEFSLDEVGLFGGI